MRAPSDSPALDEPGCRALSAHPEKVKGLLNHRNRLFLRRFGADLCRTVPLSPAGQSVTQSTIFTSKETSPVYTVADLLSIVTAAGSNLQRVVLVTTPTNYLACALVRDTLGPFVPSRHCIRRPACGVAAVCKRLVSFGSARCS